MWPATAEELVALQEHLADLVPPPWHPTGDELIAGCFVCFPRGGSGVGAAGDPAWAGAAALRGRRVLAAAWVTSESRAPYRPGLLALREGPALEAAVRALRLRPDVLLVNATGRDHPRRAGLALHLGAILDIPTVGITNRSLLAEAPDPGPGRGDAAPLRIGGEVVGARLRTRPGAHPVAVHAAWRTDPDGAVAVAMSATRRSRTPEPLRRARTLARLARSGG